jgi:hypothetical protein
MSATFLLTCDFDGEEWALLFPRSPPFILPRSPAKTATMPSTRACAKELES